MNSRLLAHVRRYAGKIKTSMLDTQIDKVLVRQKHPFQIPVAVGFKTISVPTVL